MFRITSTPNVVNGHTNGNHSYTNGNSNNSNDNSTNVNYDKLKQELIVEFRKELQSIKADIISCKF